MEVEDDTMSTGSSSDQLALGIRANLAQFTLLIIVLGANYKMRRAFTRIIADSPQAGTTDFQPNLVDTL